MLNSASTTLLESSSDTPIWYGLAVLEPGPDLLHAVSADSCPGYKLDLAGVAPHALFEIDLGPPDGACGASQLTCLAKVALVHPLDTE